MDSVIKGLVDSADASPAYYAAAKRAIPEVAACGALTHRRLDELQALVVTKTVSGFDAACVAELRAIVAQAAAGELGALKFITFEFAHEGNAPSLAAEGFHALVSEVANLILRAPVVSVACARGHMEGADLEFALACSMLIGEDGANFSFAGDPVTAVATYGFLAQKIGFVRAEWLMEEGAVLDAAQMRDLLLLKDVAERGAGLGAMEQFLRRTGRRHNSCYGIYRAQRIASPTFDESLRTAS